MGNSNSVDEVVDNKVRSVTNNTIVDVLYKNTYNSNSVVNSSNELNIGGIVVGSKIGKQTISSKIDMSMLLNSQTNDKIQDDMINSIVTNLKKEENLQLSPQTENAIKADISNSYRTNFSKEKVVSMLSVIYASNKMNIGGLVVGSTVEGQDINSNVVMQVADNISGDILVSLKNKGVYDMLAAAEERNRSLQNTTVAVCVLLIIVVIFIAGYTVTLSNKRVVNETGIKALTPPGNIINDQAESI